jgi:hypothetical protein
VGNAYVFGRWILLFNFKGTPSCTVFRIKQFAPLEPKLLVLWKRVGEVLKMVCSAYQFATDMVLTPIGVVLFGV